MEAQNTEMLAALPAAHGAEPQAAPTQAPIAAPRHVKAAPSLRLVGDALTLVDPPQAPGADWDEALARIAAWLAIAVKRVPAADRSAGLRQLARWPVGAAAPSAPVFAPWLVQSCLAFQDRRSLRGMLRADWVASYLWDPCAAAPRGSRALDVVLISPHPAACRAEEECDANLPGTRLLRGMIDAAVAEGRRRIAIVGHDRCRSVVTRQLLAAGPMPRDEAPAIEVIAIEEAVVRLAQDAAAWDAIIVLPELRSLVFAMLAKVSGISAPWPMAWHRQDRLLLLCGETAGQAAPDQPLDSALLVQALALAAARAGNPFAARRLADGWARLRDRGMVTPTRGSPAPYARQASDAEFVEWLCREPAEAGRSVAAWKALAPSDQPAAAERPPVRLALVTEG